MRVEMEDAADRPSGQTPSTTFSYDTLCEIRYFGMTAESSVD
jgi:hypothetical protein